MAQCIVLQPLQQWHYLLLHSEEKGFILTLGQKEILSEKVKNLDRSIRQSFQHRRIGWNN